ncbi:BMP family lipoprotein [Haloquadratum walsbyi]|jgi:basic membrane protein A|uniref:ABC-type transport system periplasmic substrate-binding protein (Probable substrate sugar) n=1 Tax=Haloquadratum walsbyi (strain DSM 16790 / HBSQ001) TaxID=362976 RepID=Q18HH4_HALWD|nr:BMP family protein [Haloquadratum walsbyi]CAJ52565.1 ABC-type transport system periplasmic substrate-binding protein (probable substrate sugar) [Haloquadratum walsbyi DSM 16790]
MDRRTFVKATGIAGIAGLAGCSGGPSGGAGNTETETESDNSGDGMEVTTATETTERSPAANIGMVYATGGLGDGSFNDQAQSGAIQAEEDFGIVYNEAQPDEVSQFSNFQQQFAQSTDPDYDLVCCIGFLQADSLAETAGSFPDQDFMIADSVVESPNVVSYTFKEHEGSYLAGLMASLLTTQDFSAGTGSTVSDSTSVGFVGGVESDLIKRFQAGFEAGVAAGSDNIDVSTNYTGSFNDPAAGREAAAAMYNGGADIIFHASGNTGTGVFQAAQEAGRFAIGVDRAQSITRDSYADIILGSMIKRVDTPVYNAIAAKVNGEFTGGESLSLGLAEEGVGLIYGDSLGSKIPADVADEVSTARDNIISGDISVPTSPE